MNMGKYVNKFLALILVSLRAITPKNERVAIVAPSPPGSIGDEALLEGMTNLVSQHGMEFDEILLYPNIEPYNKLEGYNKAINFKYSGRLSLFFLAIKLIRHKSLYIIGADCLDGRYSAHMIKTWIAISDFAVSIGLPANIVSFSFSKHPNKQTVNVLKNSDARIRFAARDYFSQQRFIDYTKKECLLVADLGFSMPPSIKSISAVETLKWINTCKNEKNAILVGLNINPLPLLVSEEVDLAVSIEDVATNYALALNQLLDENRNIYVIGLPHDIREGQSDYDILELTKAQVEKKDRFEILKPPFSAADIKGIAGHMDLVISGRMHLAIAALSQAIPTYCVVYLNKFEGLMRHFDLEDNLAPTSIINQSSKIYSFLVSSIDERQHQLIEIPKKIKQVKSLSILNFDN